MERQRSGPRLIQQSEERIVPPPWGQDDEEYQEHLKRYQFAYPLVKNLRVLDVACGSGFGAAMLARDAHQVVGVDLSSEALSFAREHYGQAKLSFHQADATQLPFPDHYFDAVVSFETIEHLRDQAGFLKELRRVLRDQGILLISTPDREIIPQLLFDPTSYSNPFHVKELSRPELEALLGTYFRKLEFYGQVLWDPEKRRREPGRVMRSARRLLRWLPRSVRLRMKERITGVQAKRNLDVLSVEKRRSKCIVVVCREPRQE